MPRKKWGTIYDVSGISRNIILDFLIQISTNPKYDLKYILTSPAPGVEFGTTFPGIIFSVNKLVRSQVQTLKNPSKSNFFELTPIIIIVILQITRIHLAQKTDNRGKIAAGSWRCAICGFYF